MNLIITDQNKAILNKNIGGNKKQKQKQKQKAIKILEGELELHQTLAPIDISNGINWNYSHNKSANTYQLYLHTLNFIKPLISQFLESEKIEYIRLAKSIVLSWIEENLDKRLTNQRNYSWYDHPVASRVQNLLYFQINAPEEFRIESELFSRVVKEHLNFLTEFKNYPENNHGIMMDKAILLTSLFISDEKERSEYISFAKSRIEKAILRDYSYESTHLENSPDYHRMVTNWLLNISGILDDLKSPLKKKLQRRMENAKNFNGIVTNYNNEYPMIGDTSHGVSQVKKIDNNFVDYEAGIAVINNAEKGSTLVYNCGFQNHTHKHYDDLSFVLTLSREQIFVDSGKYNYSKEDPIRQYMISPSAHTTLYIKDREYALSPSDNLKITEMYQKKNYTFIKSLHGLYDNIKIERSIVALHNGTVIILDDIESNQQNTYIQNFVLNTDINIELIGRRTYLLSTPKNNQYIVQEHSPKGSSRILEGKKENAMISRVFNQVEDTTRLEILKKTVNTTFITTISERDNEVIDIKLTEDKIFIEDHTGKYEIGL